MVQVLVPVVVLMTIIVLLPALVLLAAIQQVAAHALAAAILQVVVEVLPVQVVAEAVLPVEAVEEDKQIRECNNSFELERTLIMNKKLTLVALSLLVSMGMGAQTIYDVTKMTEKDLNGTARFVGMGGAMGALGGDMSTIATNPAGIGIYRSDDVTASFGFSSTGTESTYGGNTFNSNKNRWQLNNAGFVLSNKIGNETTLRYVNFGFSYNRSKSFNKTTSMEGLLNLTPDGQVVSQTFLMASQAGGMLENGYDIKYIDDNATPNNNVFNNNNVGWLAALGWGGSLYDPLYEDVNNKDRLTGFGAFLPQPYSKFRSRETGGVDQYDFNISFNFNDRVYLGVTVGAYDLNYTKSSIYSEDYDTGEYYDLNSWTKIDGTGFDFKLGAIIRPFETSPLRIGLAIHTPTFYKLTLATNVFLESGIYGQNDKGETEFYKTTVDSYDFLDNKDMTYDYELRTPWKYNLSLGYTVGTNLALGAEYEYQDYSSIRLYYPEGDEMGYENSTIKEMLKGVSTFRIGAEYKVIPEFALRAGYNYSTAAYKDGAYKDLPLNSVMTDTDYANAKSKSNYTLGIGYRGSLVYADLAYQYSTYKSDFYAFDDEYLNKTKVTNTRSQVIFTLGMRF